MESLRVRCFLIDKLYLHLQFQDININPEEIPVYALKDSWPIQYHCAIALKLAKINNHHPVEIATHILQGLSGESEWVEIGVNVTLSGIIAFELTDQAIATWLQQMTQTPLPLSSFPVSSTEVFIENNDQNLFKIQYAHARCCSLLRLADRDQIIFLAEPSVQTTPALWLFSEPKLIPWLECNRKLRLQHDRERRLISQLLTSFDLDQPASDQKYWKTKANLISDAFQEFYRQCQIWGEVKLETPELAQARLGLISVTQAVLRYILQEKLGLIAPLEL
ncbi:MAG: DALR anticodon-binding domain-containing protein [Cyanobacteriota bacterium]|nr:DALR anticodon-binding domain-containing protein [Cyanobacteriota bacterium]